MYVLLVRACCQLPGPLNESVVYVYMKCGRRPKRVQWCQPALHVLLA